MTDIIIQNHEITTSSPNAKQRNLPQMKQKTISRHFNKVIHYFRKDENEWTRQKVAKLIIEIAFWTPIHILFGYLTISGSIDLIQQYQANPIYLNMTAMINQPKAIFPNYTICSYFNVTEVFDAVDTLRKKNSTSSYSEDLDAFFIDYGEALQNDTSYLISWPSTTSGVIVRYLIMMYGYESLREQTEHQLAYQQFQQSNDDYWAAVNNVLVPKIAEYNITIDQLKATFQRAFKIFDTTDFLDFCMFEFFQKRNGGTLGNCMPYELISFIGRDSFCFRLHSNNIQSEGRDDTTYLIYINGAEGKGKSALRWPFSLDFTGRSTPPPQTLPVNETDYVFFSSNNEGEYHFDINITVLYVSKPGIEKICSPNATKKECESLCRSNQIKQLCGCAPISFSKNYASDTFANCTMEKYKNCSQYLANEDRNCSDKCVPNCAKWYYKFVVNSETYSWTFELFIGALGGAIGIWHGLDFGILIGFVFNPIMMLIRKLLSFIQGAPKKRNP